MSDTFIEEFTLWQKGITKKRRQDDHYDELYPEEVAFMKYLIQRVYDQLHGMSFEEHYRLLFNICLKMNTVQGKRKAFNRLRSIILQFKEERNIQNDAHWITVLRALDDLSAGIRHLISMSGPAFPFMETCV